MVEPSVLSEVLQSHPLGRKVREVAFAAQEAGGRALLVGGYVRDALLGMHPKDADLEVYGLQPDVLKSCLERLGRVGAVGESFRVYKLTWRVKGERQELDVALPRRDRKVGEGHRGFEVEGDPYASVEDAARRRDFTLNAILWDPLQEELIDPYGGVRDLENKTLRMVDAAHFGEDSLRVLRAMQFAARFDLTVEPGTVAVCRATPVDDLPRERVWGEVEKWLLKSPRPSVGLRTARELDVLARLFPGLENACLQREVELAQVLDRAAQLKEGLPHERQVALMLAALGCFLGQSGTEELLDTLNIHRLKTPEGAFHLRKVVLQLVAKRKTVADWYRKGQVEDKDFRFFSALVNVRLLLLLCRSRGQEQEAAWFEQEMARLNLLDGPPEQWLQGRDLLAMGITPGPAVGRILQSVYAAQLAGEVTSVEEAREMGARLMAGEGN